MRRRLPQKEIAFSFDSFLDLVANVVGIILRLILVAWVGARTYKAAVPPPPAPPPALADPAPLPDPTDPRQELLARRREQLAGRGDEARREDERRAAADDVARRLRLDLKALAARRQTATADEEAARREAGRRGRSAGLVGMGIAELEARSKRLTAELEKLRRLPRPRKELRYHTPVSAPVTEEVMFECKAARVALIDTAALLAD